MTKPELVYIVTYRRKGVRTAEVRTSTLRQAYEAAYHGLETGPCRVNDCLSIVEQNNGVDLPVATWEYDSGRWVAADIDGPTEENRLITSTLLSIVRAMDRGEKGGVDHD